MSFDHAKLLFLITIILKELFQPCIHAVHSDRRIERFHSRGQRPYCFTKSKDDFCIKIDFNSGGMTWYTDMAAVSLFWNTNMAAVTSYKNAL